MPFFFLARERPLDIAAYAGFRNETQLYVRARLLRRRKPGWKKPGRLSKLVGMVRLFASHEVPGKRVTLSGFGRRVEVVTDEEGFAIFDIDIGTHPLPSHAEWQSVVLSLPDHAELEPAEAPVLAPGTDHRLCVISDIDDTIIETGAHDFARNWRRVAMEMPGDRMTVPGAQELFGRLGDPEGPEPGTAPRRAFFYVSSSPWNLYGFLAEFKKLKGLPRGPMLLKDWGLNRQTFGASSHGAHKTGQIETILGFYPDHRFILIGDDTQGDAEAYATAVRDYPKRVAAVFLRVAAGEKLSPDKQATLDAIRDTGTPVWTGPAFDAGHAMLDSLGLDPEGDAARIVEATRPAG